MEDAVQVDVDHLLPLVDRVVPERVVAAGDAGVGDQDVDAAEGLAGRRGRGLDVAGVDEIDDRGVDAIVRHQLAGGAGQDPGVTIPQ